MHYRPLTGRSPGPSDFMKTTLTYEFDKPEESDQLKTILAANDYRSALWDFTQEIRKKIKYDETSSELAVWQEVSDLLWQIIEDYGVEL